jgi:hypothetical protein
MRQFFVRSKSGRVLTAGFMAVFWMAKELIPNLIVTMSSQTPFPWKGLFSQPLLWITFVSIFAYFLLTAFFNSREAAELAAYNGFGFQSFLERSANCAFEKMNQGNFKDAKRTIRLMKYFERSFGGRLK